jgi:CysZ protein
MSIPLPCFRLLGKAGKVGAFSHCPEHPMPAPVLSGPQYLREGLKLVLSPGLRLFVLLPLAINLLLFVGLIYLAGHQFSLWVDTLMPSLPDWLSFLSYVLWPLFVVLVLLMVFFTFTMLANIIAAPFNGFLAEKVEVVVRGTDDFPAFSWGELVAMVPRTLAREMRKLGYFLPRALALFILSFIPAVNLIAAPLWLIFGVWMMAIQYIDYPADNHKLGWNEMLAWLREKRWQSMSFGGSVYLVLLIPVVNILMMPAAVAGATLFWVRERGAENLVARQR